jgi:hypothetical protein
MMSYVGVEASDQLHAPAVIPPGERDPRTHWIGSWVGPRAGLGAVETRKILHCRELNPGRPARSPLLYRLSYPNSRNNNY